MISLDEIAAMNEFVKTLGCVTCVNVTDASLCQAAHVRCDERPNRYSLVLSERNMTGFVDGSVWQRMPNCIRLSLERNALTGTLPVALFDSSSPLLWLYAQFNRLSGTLPSAPASGVLEKLVVSGNKLEGTIPIAYLTLQRIFHLHLDGNRFSGDFPRPPVVNTSQELDNFFAGDNEFTGTIGTEWARLTKLKSLYFRGSSNRLTGTIPDLFATHKFAYFDFDDNELSGTIPSSLSRQSTLVRLNISHNMLSGSFVAPSVRDFCVTTGNRFDSCSERPGAIGALCCVNAQSTSMTTSTTTGATQTPLLGSMASIAATAFSSLLSTGSDVTPTSRGQRTADVPAPMREIDTALIGAILGTVGGLLLLTAIVALVACSLRKSKTKVDVSMRGERVQHDHDACQLSCSFESVARVLDAATTTRKRVLERHCRRARPGLW